MIHEQKELYRINVDLLYCKYVKKFVGWSVDCILSIISVSQSSRIKMVSIVYKTLKKSEFRVFMTSLHQASQISPILVPYQCVLSISIGALRQTFSPLPPPHQTLVYSIPFEAYSIVISYFTRTTYSPLIMNIQGCNAQNQKHVNPGWGNNLEDNSKYKDLLVIIKSSFYGYRQYLY